MNRNDTFYYTNKMSVTLEGMIERIDSFEEFERRFSQDSLNDDEFLNSTKAFPKTVIFGHTPSLMITRKCDHISHPPATSALIWDRFRQED